MEVLSWVSAPGLVSILVYLLSLDSNIDNTVYLHISVMGYS